VIEAASLTSETKPTSDGTLVAGYILSMRPLSQCGTSAFEASWPSPNTGGQSCLDFILAVLTAILLVASSMSGFAAQGASNYAPSQIYNKKHHQSLAGHPGASGYAPGQQFRMHNKRTAQGLPGASGYAPGHKKY
jgi:hypothetical protein